MDFGQILWLMYSETGNEQYKTLAEEVETRMDEACMDWMEVLDLYHVLIMWMLLSVANTD